LGFGIAWIWDCLDLPICIYTSITTSRCGSDKGGASFQPPTIIDIFDVSVLTKRGGSLSQIQTTSPTIRYRPHITPIEQIRGVGSHIGGRKAGFEVWVLAKGGLVCITHTPLLLNRFEVAVLTKGGRRSQIQTTSQITIITLH
jgi:hypothetical protein